MDILFEDVSDFHINIAKNSNAYEMPFFHYHNCYEILVLTEGKRKMIVQDKIYQGYGGDVFLIPAKHFHRTKGTGCARIVINFSEKYLDRFFKREMVAELLRCFDVFMISFKEKEFEKIIELCKAMVSMEGKHEEKKLSLKLAEFLMLLSENVNYDIRERMVSNSMQLASDILSFINGNYKELTDIGEIAENFYISREYLCRIFKRYTGTTVISYLTGLKLKSAQQMLMSTRKTVAEIAVECGYSSSSYFSKVFKRNCGLSPYDYRNENRENDIKLQKGMKKND